MSNHDLGFVQWVIVLLLLSSWVPASGQEVSTMSLTKPTVTTPRVVLDVEPPERPPATNQVLERFVKSDSAVRESLNQYTFKRDVLLQTIGSNGEVTGEYTRRSQFLFDDRGNRIERVLYHPAPSLKNMKITKEDIQDLAGAQLLGNPHKMRERFVGRVWADADTLQIVKVRGKVEPQGKQRFPLFETWREVPAGNLLFPSRTHADDILHFPKFDVHYRVQVRYYDYKLFTSKVTITEIDESTPISDSSINNSSKRSEIGGTCKTNRTAPPVATFSWPPDSNVRVHFVRGSFTVEQRQTLIAAMTAWNTAAKKIGAGVAFVDAGDTNRRVTCERCLTIDRKGAHHKDRRYYAYFFPVKYDRNGWLESAWIEFDAATTDPKALQGYMAHELGHGLGLENCANCKKSQSIMNSFPDINRHNGLISPSPCDLEVVKGIYVENRRLAGRSTESLAAVPDGR